MLKSEKIKVKLCLSLTGKVISFDKSASDKITTIYNNHTYVWSLISPIIYGQFKCWAILMAISQVISDINS